MPTRRAHVVRVSGRSGQDLQLHKRQSKVSADGSPGRRGTAVEWPVGVGARATSVSAISARPRNSIGYVETPMPSRTKLTLYADGQQGRQGPCSRPSSRSRLPPRTPDWAKAPAYGILTDSPAKTSCPSRPDRHLMHEGGSGVIGASGEGHQVLKWASHKGDRWRKKLD